MGDMIRNVGGSLGVTVGNATVSAPFNASIYSSIGYISGTDFKVFNLDMILSTSVPTGPENSPRTYSELIWRRVA